MRHVANHPFGPTLSVDRYRFANGLELLLSIDRSAPVASYMTWFDVGSRHEREGTTGIAHLFEHLMFHETASLPHGELDRRYEEAGIECNAATYLDWTYYVENLPSEALPLVVATEAERMHALTLRDDTLESEREVVRNERRQTVDDDVDGAVAELLWSTAFERHGYRFPTIGRMTDIEALSLAQCRAFYQTHYAPNNARIVVVGDVDVAALCALIEQHYGGLAAATLPAEEARPEPQQTCERRLRTVQPCATPHVSIGYRAPACAQTDHAALVLLNEILMGGRSSRAYRSLVIERELASDVRGYVGFTRDPGLYEVQVIGRGEAPPTALCAALDAIIDTVRREPVAESELERALARVEIHTLQGLDTVGGKAEQIGFSDVVLGDPSATWTRLEAYRRLTRGELLAAAQRWLGPVTRTVIEVEPDERTRAKDDDEDDEDDE